MHWEHVETRLGRFLVAADGGKVNRILLPGSPGVPRLDAPGLDDDLDRDRAVVAQAAQELRMYCEGRLESFTFPTEPEGTTFQKAVWDALTTIPYGETRTYADVAKAIDRPGAARAVGGANRANPLPLVVPCHRVVASDGLGGYNGMQGVEMKERLLGMEQGRAD